jgi:nitroreductase
MELIEIIKRRRSIRAYENKKVERELLVRVLDAGRLAPSARNLQDWKFIVVRNLDMRTKIAHACKSEDFVKEAPVVIAACGTNPDYVMSCGQKAYPIDISIALTHMMLRAEDLGLGTCWLGAFNERRVKELLRIPNKVRIVALLTLGYSRFQPHPKNRKPLDEVICFENWK